MAAFQTSPPSTSVSLLITHTQRVFHPPPPSLKDARKYLSYAHGLAKPLSDATLQRCHGSTDGTVAPYVQYRRVGGAGSGYMREWLYMTAVSLH